jgi:sigma-B regulation protein RsbU (phosphoserine phosphatase)
MLYASTESNRYATLFYGVYDPALRRLTFVNAGHNPPLLIRSLDRSILYLEAGGPPVGLLPNSRYAAAGITIETGDTFIGFTDGIVEATGEQGEFFGQDRLETLARTNQGMTPEDLRNLILAEAAGFTGSLPQADDETLLIALLS